MGNGSGQSDMPHAFAPHFGTGHFDAAAVADDALIANFLVFTTITLPVLGGTENALAEQAVLFRAKCPIVNGLWLGYLAIGPDFDLVW